MTAIGLTTRAPAYAKAAIKFNYLIAIKSAIRNSVWGEGNRIAKLLIGSTKGCCGELFTRSVCPGPW